MVIAVGVDETAVVDAVCLLRLVASWPIQLPASCTGHGPDWPAH